MEKVHGGPGFVTNDVQEIHMSHRANDMSQDGRNWWYKFDNVDKLDKGFKLNIMVNRLKMVNKRETVNKLNIVS